MSSTIPEPERVDLGEAVVYPSDGGPAFAARLELHGTDNPDMIDHVRRAIAAFGPGTTAGGRAEAGWHHVGTIAEDGIVFKSHALSPATVGELVEHQELDQ